ncbi:MAG: ATP-binding protein [Reichenbachiella sp.]|uniref:tetratricopeptide repeat-containing sensor histidine kinase n=1 Tax=Reichenbachiella sp. TaxID=2184521 RepID=UPI0032679535
MATIIFIVAMNYRSHVFGQNQSKADSLKLVLLENDTLSVISKISTLDKIAIFSASPEEKLIFADSLLTLATEENLSNYVSKAFLHKGVAYRLKGALKKSLEHLLQSINIAIEINNYDLQVKIYGEIATTYSANDDSKNAIFYDNMAIEVLRQHGKKQPLAINLLNTGYSYYNLGILDSAMLLYNEAEPIFEEVGLAIGKAYTVGNRALVYWKLGDLDRAEEDLLAAIAMLEPLGDQYGMADYHNQLGRIYLEQDDIEKTIWHTEKAIQMGEDLGLKEQIRDASLLLSELYNSKKNFQKALEYQTQYLHYKDSIENTEQTKKMADLRTEFEVNLREKEIDLLEKREALQWTYIAIAIALLILAIVLLLYFRQRFRTTQLMASVERKKQKDRIKDLLGAQETKALQSMVKGRDSERRRLAQELHNHFGSLLATIKVNLNGLETTKKDKHKTIAMLVDQACSDIRSLSHTLNMGISENFGLVPALRELTAHLQQSGGLEVEFSAAMGEHQLDSDNEIIIYRIIQELVSNVLKHAEATKLSISLTCFEEEKYVNILVEDNGKGFDRDKVEMDSDGMGLGSLKEMVVGIQGDIRFDSHPTSGTTVNIDLPITSQANLIT